MAALICGSIGKACSGLASGCGSLCTLPFKVCGECCKCATHLVSECCQATGTIVCSPFFPYLALTALLNLPPIGFAISASLSADCEKANWLFVNCALCLVHVVASIYIVRKIQCTQQEEHAELVQVPGSAEKGNVEVGTARVSTTSSSSNKNNNNDSSEAGSRQRMKQVMCYDPCVAIYMLLAAGWLAWLIVGYIGLIDMDDDEECDEINGFYFASLGVGTLFAMMVCCAFACSFLCLR